MALHIKRDAFERIQFRIKATGEVVEVQSRFIHAMTKIVPVGEPYAISVAAALRWMGVANTGTHQRQWRHAADFWQEENILVCATTKGYFIPANEAERALCLAFKQTTIDALERRKHRLAQIPLGKQFPQKEA